MVYVTKLKKKVKRGNVEMVYVTNSNEKRKKR